MRRANDNTRDEVRSLHEVVSVLTRQVRSLNERVDAIEGRR